MWKTIAATAALGLLLAGCGTSPEERGITGAGLGAATGAAGSAIAGGDAGTGALIGGVAGGAAGALTEEETIDLGDPLWERF
jgi:hypothetical protein